MTEPQSFREPKSFEEFWPVYLRAHSDRKTRAVHLAGTVAGLVCGVMFLTTLNFLWAVAGMVAAYGAAWLSHALFERNTPATFSHPLWSLRGDFKMLGLALTGRLDKEAAAARLP